MNANGREYPVTLDVYEWAFLQRIEHVRFREIPCPSVVNPFLLTTEFHGKFSSEMFPRKLFFGTWL